MSDNDVTDDRDPIEQTARDAARRTRRTAKKGRKKAKARNRKPGTALQSFRLSHETLQLLHPDPAKQRALAGYLKHGTVTGACDEARVGRTTWYEWIDADATFKRLVGDAGEAVADALESVAHRRAVKGSDTLLIFLLKSLRAKFRDRQTITLFSPEIQVALRATVELIASQPTWDSTELLARVEAFWK